MMRFNSLAIRPYTKSPFPTAYPLFIPGKLSFALKNLPLKLEEDEVPSLEEKEISKAPKTRTWGQAFWDVASSVSKGVAGLLSTSSTKIPPKALNNPGNNCFMNAGFQSFFANAERLAWVRGCLATISEGDRFDLLPFDLAKARWKDHEALMESDWKEAFKLEEGEVGDGRIGDCLRITLKEAAKEMLTLLDKWETTGLSAIEGKRLRELSLTLASYEGILGGKESYRAFHLSPDGVTIGGMNLSHRNQEDGAEFMTYFVDSLHELSPDTYGFENLQLCTATVLGSGERRDEKPISVTNIFVFTDEVDLAGGFLSTYGNDFKEGEVQVETRTEITHFPQFLRMTVGLFTDEEKIFPSEYQFNGESPYELVIQGNHYQLDSFVVHQGNTAKSGHYYTYARETVEGIPTWIQYNDGHISPVKDSEIFDLFNGGSDNITPYDLMFSKTFPIETSEQKDSILELE